MSPVLLKSNSGRVGVEVFHKLISSLTRKKSLIPYNFLRITLCNEVTYLVAGNLSILFTRIHIAFSKIEQVFLISQWTTLWHFEGI